MREKYYTYLYIYIFFFYKQKFIESFYHVTKLRPIWKCYFKRESLSKRITLIISMVITSLMNIPSNHRTEKKESGPN